ncbi:MAG: glycosyl hydrolase 115 family protein [Acidobacteriia bacterium]|nr:glycosyl hydrolase 115 family protein [Terriglobia bacterium]
MRIRTTIFALCLWSPTLFAIDQTSYVTGVKTAGSFPIIGEGGCARLFVDRMDWPGVIRAVTDLQNDVGSVSGFCRPELHTTADALVANAILIGTIGKSPVIDRLIEAGKIDVSRIRGKWESFFLEVVNNPLPQVSKALVIVGSDKRGTIYGIYDLSEQMGVSPWYWWADVPVRHQKALYVKRGKYQQGEPSVKYRGIFLNDEAPDLTNWVAEKFGTIAPSVNPPIPANVANYNHEFYARIFEVLLRLKGNYLWPAMWNNAFNEDDPENARLADEFGIVMGTSHQEPMLRAQKEWDRRYQKTLGSWNYYRYPDVLQNFWREGIRRNKGYESIITIGLRGADDTPMIPGGTVAESMAMLEDIVAAQRRMISEEINLEVTRVPQLWCLYKEVLEYYKAGLRVPDDVTLLWPDDNWGNIRRLPTEAERRRAGGAGIYYHFDYVGGPRNYKWINTNPIPKIWEQLTLAKEYGADRVWIVNVGHFKGLEFPVEYFMRLAWNTGRWTNRNLGEYTRLWAAREFGPAYSAEIAEIISRYTRYNGRRKPELLEPATYSAVHYHEAERVVADFNEIAAKSEAIAAKLPPEQRDAFYQLVLFPAKACAQVNELYAVVGKNALYAQQGRAATNELAAKAEALFKADADLMNDYSHNLGGGKWNHFMDQVHIGYTIWQDPPRNVMPHVTRIQLPEAADMGVAVEGSTAFWPGTAQPLSLPTFDRFNRQRHFLEVFNRGQGTFTFTATASVPWIVLDAAKGIVVKEERIWAAVDWRRAPAGSGAGTIRIAREGGQSVEVKVAVINPEKVDLDREGMFVEDGGVVSMEAEHCTRNMPSAAARWERIEGYGRTLSAMTILPNTAPVAAPPKNSPRLEYDMYLFDAGDVTVHAVVAPTLNFIPGRGLRYAVSFDDQPPQIIEIVRESFDARNGNREWEESVKDAARTVRSTHNLAAAGRHTLKIWMVDPAVGVQKIVVDLGGLQPSYLGPPESYRSAKGTVARRSARVKTTSWNREDLEDRRERRPSRSLWFKVRGAILL